jgi:hypothetical protein
MKKSSKICRTFGTPSFVDKNPIKHIQKHIKDEWCGDQLGGHNKKNKLIEWVAVDYVWQHVSSFVIFGNVRRISTGRG